MGCSPIRERVIPAVIRSQAVSAIILEALFGFVVRLMRFGVKEFKDRKLQDSRKDRNVNNPHGFDFFKFSGNILAI
jgi:hypothetical protein